MKRIHYSDDVIVTGDAIAEALMDYARELAMSGRSDSVDVPAVDQQGAGQRIQVLLGPASQMVTSESLWSGPEIVDDDLVADLRARLGGISAPRPRSTPEASDVSPDLDGEAFRPHDFDPHQG
ncbi:hypothetical protein EDF38_2723 [Frigoribacterium sp. PhB160]|uniref:hypothetical protein n=1 Tax=Frigoribacterium sp. PhB160 TaxID=2485192 RepID=UPI000F493CC0|nr:hypothetical protein [Frigoribacterium sp. PhB160]ROS57993.1 hypothetical protein EDF38_2723 [Frigoribacterium sp. PhB160]